MDKGRLPALGKRGREMNRFKCPACGGNQYTSCDTAEGCIYCGHKELKKMDKQAQWDIETLQKTIGVIPYEEMERDAIERAIKALEKQVPQKVKKYKGLNETACPECGIAFGYYEYDDEKFDYCYNCGQKLDWESEVEEG